MVTMLKTKTVNIIFKLLMIVVLLAGCNSQNASRTFHEATKGVFTYHGRILKNDLQTSLIGSASGVEFAASGDSLELRVKSNNNGHNYLSISIDGIYYDRLQINSDSINTIKIALPKNKNTFNEIGVYKATEAANGAISFYGAKAKEISSTQIKKEVTIEFIGNSITCGMGADFSSIPCGAGEWYDQHNAYLAYGPRLARALNANYILSSVSGIGMYRNWNDENILEPVMPDVYNKLFLNMENDSTFAYSYTQIPNIIGICLGTNDLSDGDGIKPRMPFNREKFIKNYKDFVTDLFQVNPNAKIVLLTSPMLSGTKGSILLECLLEIKEHFATNQEISIFEFQELNASGCSSHPNVEEHKIMAEQLKPFMKKLID